MNSAVPPHRSGAFTRRPAATRGQQPPSLVKITRTRRRVAPIAEKNNIAKLRHPLLVDALAARLRLRTSGLRRRLRTVTSPDPRENRRHRRQLSTSQPHLPTVALSALPPSASAGRGGRSVSRARRRAGAAQWRRRRRSDDLARSAQLRGRPYTETSESLLPAASATRTGWNVRYDTGPAGRRTGQVRSPGGTSGTTPDLREDTYRSGQVTGWNVRYDTGPAGRRTGQVRSPVGTSGMTPDRRRGIQVGPGQVRSDQVT